MDGTVVKRVEKLFACCVPTDASRQQKKASPPWVVFHWGGMTGFPAFVSQRQRQVHPVHPRRHAGAGGVHGDAGGDLRRAGRAEPHLRARWPPGTSHVVVAGDTLHSVAYQAYGDAGLWRPIAEANDIDDPMRLRAGHRRCWCPRPEELSGRVANEQFANALLVEVAGSPLPAEIAALLTYAASGRQPQPARPVRAALPRPGPDGAGQGRASTSAPRSG